MPVWVVSEVKLLPRQHLSLSPWRIKNGVMWNVDKMPATDDACMRSTPLADDAELYGSNVCEAVMRQSREVGNAVLKAVV